MKSHPLTFDVFVHYPKSTLFLQASFVFNLMVKHLENDYELDQKPTGFVPHFWDTIDSLGGPLGLVLMTLAFVIFYYVVDYMVTSSRKKRELKKSK